MTNLETKIATLGVKGRSEVRLFLKEWLEIEFKIVGYLLASHAAGIITCLSVLKDYKDNPQFKGIGILSYCLASVLFLRLCHSCFWRQVWTPCIVT